MINPGGNEDASPLRIGNENAPMISIIHKGNHYNLLKRVQAVSSTRKVPACLQKEIDREDTEDEVIKNEGKHEVHDRKRDPYTQVNDEKPLVNCQNYIEGLRITPKVPKPEKPGDSLGMNTYPEENLTEALAQEFSTMASSEIDHKQKNVSSDSKFQVSTFLQEAIDRGESEENN